MIVGLARRRRAGIAPFAVLLALAAGWWSGPAACGQGSWKALDSAMFDDPRIVIPEPCMVFSNKVAPLWIAALSHAEADLRQQSARTIAWAHERGLQNLDAAIAPLTHNVAHDRQLVVRLASARALVELDARSSAEILFQCGQTGGLEMAQIIEPALGQWGFAPIREVWRRRLPDPQVDRGRKLLAIRGLQQMQDTAAPADLQKLACDADQSPDVRVAAAVALSVLRHDGLEAAARELTARTPPNVIDRVVAARLLRQHSSAETRTLLETLAQDDESSVAALALERLRELDPSLVVPLAARALAKGDTNVRRVVARALVERPSEQTIPLLGDLLGDPHPGLRAGVTDDLLKLAAAGPWRAAIIQQGERQLQSDRWQALEQALRLLASLDHREPVPRYLELAEHPRPEVCITAAWGLRRLGLDETLAPLLKLAQRRCDPKEAAAQQQDAGRDGLLAQLFQFFGQKRYAPADPLLRKLLPKDYALPQARAAAVWALGYLHEGQPDRELVKVFQERLRDVLSLVPELEIVRRFSAVSLGRMKAGDALPTLRMFSEPGGIDTPVGYACSWSIQQITGEPFAPPQARTVTHTDFFLDPAPPYRTKPAPAPAPE